MWKWQIKTWIIIIIKNVFTVASTNKQTNNNNQQSGKADQPGGNCHSRQTTGDGHNSSFGFSDERKTKLSSSNESEDVYLHDLSISIHRQPFDLTECCPTSVVQKTPKSIWIILIDNS